MNLTLELKGTKHPFRKLLFQILHYWSVRKVLTCLAPLWYVSDGLIHDDWLSDRWRWWLRLVEFRSKWENLLSLLLILQSLYFLWLSQLVLSQSRYSQSTMHWYVSWYDSPSSLCQSVKRLFMRKHPILKEGPIGIRSACFLAALLLSKEKLCPLRHTHIIWSARAV